MYSVTCMADSAIEHLRLLHHWICLVLHVAEPCWPIDRASCFHTECSAHMTGAKRNILFCIIKGKLVAKEEKGTPEPTKKCVCVLCICYRREVVLVAVYMHAVIALIVSLYLTATSLYTFTVWYCYSITSPMEQSNQFHRRQLCIHQSINCPAIP